MNHIRFFVDFCRGKARARTSGGRFYTPPQTRADMEAIAYAYRMEGGTMIPKGVPISIKIIAHKQLPKNERKSRPFFCKPDGDNIAKLIADALNGVAFEDDAQVTDWAVHKTDRTDQGGDWMHVTVGWDA